jgi:cell division protease FtsH
MGSKYFRRGGIYIVILVALAVLFLMFFPSGEEIETGTINDLIIAYEQGEITKFESQGDYITGWDDDEAVIQVETGPFENLAGVEEYLDLRGVDINAVEIAFIPPSGFNWGNILLTMLPLVLFIGVIWFIFSRARGAGNQAMSFGKSKARLFPSTNPSVTFSDVAGVEEAKMELQEVVEFLKSPEKFSALGARIPRGVLLVGPPGTGKTLLSRAVAGEAGVPFFSMSGSEFVEMFVGVGASRVRDLFEQAKRNSPCIIFIDEIDAVGRHRGAGMGGGHDEREQTLNQILVEMDGFDTSNNVIVLAATNRPDKTVAKLTPGFSGADLANLVNEAAILAARRDKKQIGLLELEESVDRVIAGPERKSRIIGPKEKNITAYHESGHALVARVLPNADPVHKVSIIARGMMGGYTRLLPTEDRYLWTRSQFNDTLATLLGGHCAEEIIFNEVSTGPESDIQQATKIARKMVTEYGMSKTLGPRSFGQKQEMIFLGREISEQKDYGDKIADAIDEEVHLLILQAYSTATEILTEKKGKLIQLAEALIVKETLEGKELEELFDGPVAEVATDEVPENQSEGVTEDPLPKPRKRVKKHD